MGKKSVTKDNKRNIRLENLCAGQEMIHDNSLFTQMSGWTFAKEKSGMGAEEAAFATSSGDIWLNKDCLLSPAEWAYVIAHCKLHLAFGHFDADKMPGYEITHPDGAVEKKVDCDIYLWNKACDIYVAKFLEDIKFGKSPYGNPSQTFHGSFADEAKIYQYLADHPEERTMHNYGTLSPKGMDMAGLEHPVYYDEKKGECNRFAIAFACALADSVQDTVCKAGGHEEKRRYRTKSERAAQWFINHYPLLGGLAAGFRISEDYSYCIQKEIQVAAVDVTKGEIYVNPSAGLNEEELKFVLAHEFLHAGLRHWERCNGRDPYLWNIACDYVINGWLVDMEIGQKPEIGLLYDEGLKNKSAEEIYDRMLEDFRSYARQNTFRGYGKGDIVGEGFGKAYASGMSLDEFYRNALSQGLEYQRNMGRGHIPAGLIEEIRALAMPPIPWDVALAKWFEEYFPIPEKKRSYARPSRRQGATPDIPRPGYRPADHFEDARTFGVVIDTSGSMSAAQLGKALGSIASYAAAREVPVARVVFCDADAYDAGYLTPEEIAGRVEAKGRGGTRLQPGVDLLETAKNFPKKGPILIITDGEIEDKMYIRHEHAFLIPKGRRLPFRAMGKVFYFD